MLNDQTIAGQPLGQRTLRLPQLDLLRGVAVLLVLAHHHVYAYPNAGFLGPLVNIKFGWTGVDLFFVLSGFLVGGLLFNEWKQSGSMNVIRFWIRRGFKIWPAYFIYVAAMAIWYVVDGSQGGPGRVLTLLLPNLLHLQSYVTSPLIHTWSLAVEEHFYLVLPLVLLLASRQNEDRRRAARLLLLAGAGILNLLIGAYTTLGSFLPLATMPEEMQSSLRPYLQTGFLWLSGLQMLGLAALFWMVAHARRSQGNNLPALQPIAIGVMALCFVYRLCNELLSSQFGLNLTYDFYATHVRIDSLFFGVLLGYWHHFRPDRLQRVARHRGLLIILGAVLVTCVPAISSFTILFSLGFVLIYLGCGCLLLAVVYTPPGKGWLGKFLSSGPSRGLAFIGYYSYSIYLWHLGPLRTWMDQWLFSRLEHWQSAEAKWVIMAVLSVGGAVLLGVLMARIIEQPFLRLRDRLFPARTDALPHLPT